MRILKHIVSGLFFEATPELLKNKKLVPASAEESEAYLAPFKPEQIQRMEKHTVQHLIPEDFDLDTDITGFGKAQLLEVAAKLKIPFPPTMKAKELLAALDEVLAKARIDRDEQRKHEEAEALLKGGQGGGDK